MLYSHDVSDVPVTALATSGPCTLIPGLRARHLLDATRTLDPVPTDCTTLKRRQWLGLRVDGSSGTNIRVRQKIIKESGVYSWAWQCSAWYT